MKKEIFKFGSKKCEFNPVNDKISLEFQDMRYLGELDHCVKAYKMASGKTRFYLMSQHFQSKTKFQMHQIYNNKK